MGSKTNLSEEISAFIGAGLGMIGSFSIIMIFLYLKEYRIFYRKLVFILSIYDLLQSISYFLPGNSGQVVCEIQYYLIVIFPEIVQFWTANISLISYLKIVKEFDDSRLNSIQKWFHFANFIPIIALIIISVLNRDYDNSKTFWCAPTSNVLIIVKNHFFQFSKKNFYILTIIRMRKSFKLITKGYTERRKNQMNQVWIEFRMSLIPLIQIIVIIPGTIRRIRDMVNPSYSNIFALDIIHSLIACSQGFWDFLIFVVFDPDIKSKIKICCFSRSKYEGNDFFDLGNYQSKKEQEFFLIKKRSENDGNDDQVVFESENESN
ncbi:g-protein coupled receptor 157-like [Anaeramoeba ignava]|uniref:G-protein coupled receptor 157-like n=1 Tax=Anaeramoeba ignava TaxID=1746090 RepID=A0A9Q0RHQ2_ANAIG|nr:g-protein coupled receptor 157-like [Anaeramoeba ignava]